MTSSEPTRSRRVIGVTGGIGTGKSTVAEILRTFGVEIADADRLAREAVAPGSPVLQQIHDRFGPVVFTASGELDRRQLGDIVFARPDEREWLEQQIHPYVRVRLEAFVRDRGDTATIALVVPLLFEAGMTDLVTEVWVVACSPERQIERLRQRDRSSDDQIAARIASQWPLQSKIDLADVIINNNGDVAELRQQVEHCLKTFPHSARGN